QSIAAVIAVAYLAVHQRGQLILGAPSLAYVKKLADYGRFAMGSSLGSILLQRLDVLMLGYFLGPASVALYNIGTKLTNYLEIPLRAVSLVIFPQLSQTFTEQGEAAMARLWEKSLSQLVALVIPPCVLLFVLARPAIVLIAGPDYASAAPVLQIFLITALIKPWGRMAGISLEAIGKPNLNFRLVWISLLLNGGWNLLFIPWVGVVGAAWATVLSMLLTTLAGLWLLKKQLPLDYTEPLRQLPGVYQGQWEKAKQRMMAGKLSGEQENI
ncbi:MAG: polysaccharide biosynthesis C-terminal domain-containing protein, partial [Bacteroidota bacterium]